MIIPATSIAVQDEATLQGYVGTLNFAGAGVTASVSGDTATVTIPGGGGGGGFTLTAFSQDLGAARRSGAFDLTGLSGLTPGAAVVIQQTAAAIASKGDARDELERDPITLTGYVFDATTIRAFWSAPSIVVGSYNFGYTVSA